MKDDQYTTLLGMIGGLTTAVANMSQEMRDGFLAVHESHQQILTAIGGQIEPLQKSIISHEDRYCSP